jgi:hypothetical protein
MIRLTESNAKSLRLKSNLQKEFTAAVHLAEAPSSARFLYWPGWSSNNLGSESAHLQSVKVLQYIIWSPTRPTLPLYTM